MASMVSARLPFGCHSKRASVLSSDSFSLSFSPSDIFSNGTNPRFWWRKNIIRSYLAEGYFQRRRNKTVWRSFSENATSPFHRPVSGIQRYNTSQRKQAQKAIGADINPPLSIKSFHIMVVWSDAALSHFVVYFSSLWYSNSRIICT